MPTVLKVCFLKQKQPRLGTGRCAHSRLRPSMLEALGLVPKTERNSQVLLQSTVTCSNRPQ